MKNHGFGLLRLSVAITISIVAMVARASEPSKKMAIMIMVDGLRADGVENAPMTNLLRLRDGKWSAGYKGFSSFTAHTLHDARPSSAANHAAIATGVTAKKSGIYKNGDTEKGNFAKWPSWLARLVEAQPQRKALFTYSWSGDEKLSPHEKVLNVPLTSVITNNWPVGGSYEEHATRIPKILSAADAPDATLYFIDFCDWGGHRSGFYPYGWEYTHDMRLADRIIGDVLSAIAARPTFANEDWLVMVTSDHGGYERVHGLWGGQVTTIPIIIAGRNVPQGSIAGMPCNYDLAAMALTHFGVNTSPMKLDAKPLLPLSLEPKRPLKDGLAAYLPFDFAAIKSTMGKASLKLKAYGATRSGSSSGVFSGCLKVAPDDNGAAGVALYGSESLKFENDGDFAFTLWVRMDGPQASQAPIVSNKDWSSGKNPGIVLIGARTTDGVKTPGVCFNSGLNSKEVRVDMGTFNIDYGEWCFYAVTRSKDGVLRVYQGGRDGRLYWIAQDATSIALKTSFPFWIGQDGTGRCKVSFNGDIDDFALWTRSLSHENIRYIYESGRKGLSLGELF